MIETSGNRQQGAFSQWLRTGKLPSALSPDGVELKFNPWHDPADGRFTFEGAGRLYGEGGGETDRGVSGRASDGVGRAPKGRSQTASLRKVAALRTSSIAGGGKRPVERGSVRVASALQRGSRPEDRQSPVAEFVIGVGDGLYDVGKETVAGVRAALTTNPVTTLRNVNSGIAGTIDAALAAEDTPALVQASRAARAIANASARDIGRATGLSAANVALAVAPGAAFARVSALRRLRMTRPRPTYEPPQVRWVKETIKSEKDWKAYNDSAPGARAGQAPALMRTIPGSSDRPVKFDGVEGDYVIDRKLKVVDAPRARGQILRQLQALRENNARCIWEVPNAKQKAKAHKMLNEMGATEIDVRIVKP